MTHRPRFALGATALTLTLALVGAACGSDEDSSDTTPTTEAPAPCAEVYTAGTGAPEGPEAIDARGEPQMQACEPDGSLQVIDEIVGSGAEVADGATLTAQYVGIGAPTGTVFDSSWSRGEPISFDLNGVIPGWTQGLAGMKEGGRRTLVIPAELAYGDSGPAPGQALVFTIDLVSVEAPAGSTAPTTLPTTAPAG